MSPREVKRWAGHPAEELRERWRREHVHLYGKIDSTMAVARDLAEEDASDGTIVLAREQTEGRGRHGRTWYSPADAGVYLSMVFRPAGPAVLPVVSVLAGLGVARELDRRFAGLAPGLKWPNDLMADDRKLGGVLGETVATEAGPRHLIVGVGLNLEDVRDALPAELRPGTTWIREHEPEADPLEVADAVVAGLEARVRGAQASLDAPTLDLLDRYDWLKGRRVRVRQSEEEEEGLPGVCVGIAPDGALLFRPDRGALRRLSSAIVEVAS